MIALGADGRIARACLALGGVGPVPMRVPDAEAVVTAAVPDPALFARAAEPCEAIEPLEDAFVPPWYRRRLAPVLAERVLATAAMRAASAHG
jgi:carbon-monoxide dehydrogenase medium subunit